MGVALASVAMDKDGERYWGTRGAWMFTDVTKEARRPGVVAGLGGGLLSM